jgi:hypothetical protein
VVTATPCARSALVRANQHDGAEAKPWTSTTACTAGAMSGACASGRWKCPRATLNGAVTTVAAGSASSRATIAASRPTRAAHPAPGWELPSDMVRLPVPSRGR